VEGACRQVVSGQRRTGLRRQGILPVVDLLPEINHLEQLMKLLEGALLFFVGRLLSDGVELVRAISHRQYRTVESDVDHQNPN
jgi:hypothetical protein